MAVNPMYDLTIKELGMIHLGISAVLSTTEEAIAHGETPPDGFLDVVKSSMEKLEAIIDFRCEQYNEFQALVESQLIDVNKQANEVISNPDSPINEYN